MADGIDGKVVVVTGGTAGVGHAAATAFAARGARVAVLARDRRRVAEVASQLERSGGGGWAVDMSDWAAVQRAADEIADHLGPVDVWVNNAMTTVFGRFADMAPEEFAKVTGNTYLSTVHGTYAALRSMRARNRGTIVQVGSALAFQSIPLQSAYCGAKHAVRGFTSSVRCELIAERSGVRIASVHLSAFDTPQFEWARSYLRKHPQPLAPIFAPEIAADAIVQAALHPRRELWVGWPAVKTILASRVAPGLAERLAARIAIEGQQIADEPVGAREGNLFVPVARPAGAHGRFDAQAKRRSLQWRLAKHRPVLLAAAAAAVIALAALAGAFAARLLG